MAMWFFRYSLDNDRGPPNLKWEQPRPIISTPTHICQTSLLELQEATLLFVPIDTDLDVFLKEAPFLLCACQSSHPRDSRVIYIYNACIVEKASAFRKAHARPHRPGESLGTSLEAISLLLVLPWRTVAIHGLLLGVAFSFFLAAHVSRKAKENQQNALPLTELRLCLGSPVFASGRLRSAGMSSTIGVLWVRFWERWLHRGLPLRAHLACGCRKDARKSQRFANGLCKPAEIQHSTCEMEVGDCRPKVWVLPHPEDGRADHDMGLFFSQPLAALWQATHSNQSPRPLLLQGGRRGPEAERSRTSFQSFVARIWKCIQSRYFERQHRLSLLFISLQASWTAPKKQLLFWSRASPKATALQDSKHRQEKKQKGLEKKPFLAAEAGHGSLLQHDRSVFFSLMVAHITSMMVFCSSFVDFLECRKVRVKVRKDWLDSFPLLLLLLLVWVFLEVADGFLCCFLCWLEVVWWFVPPKKGVDTRNPKLAVCGWLRTLQKTKERHCKYCDYAIFFLRYWWLMILFGLRVFGFLMGFLFAAASSGGAW